jgi:hypothetical protein
VKQAEDRPVTDGLNRDYCQVFRPVLAHRAPTRSPRAAIGNAEAPDRGVLQRLVAGRGRHSQQEMGVNIDAMAVVCPSRFELAFSTGRRATRRLEGRGALLTHPQQLRNGLIGCGAAVLPLDG